MVLINGSWCLIEFREGLEGESSCFWGCWVEWGVHGRWCARAGALGAQERRGALGQRAMV